MSRDECAAALPPHDHTIEPGEINRRGCVRCEIDREASAATPSPRCPSVSVGGLRCQYPEGHQASHGYRGAEWSVGRTEPPREVQVLRALAAMVGHDLGRTTP